MSSIDKMVADYLTENEYYIGMTVKDAELLGSEVQIKLTDGYRHNVTLRIDLLELLAWVYINGRT